MEAYAQLLALRYDCVRTRHSYYRQLGLITAHSRIDPALITEAIVQAYLVMLKIERQWRPKSLRQAVAALRLFFQVQLGLPPWKVFSQIQLKDHRELPTVLSRAQVTDLIGHIRLRRYRTPVKLIYCCGLRLSECLGLTVHDILADEKLIIVRDGKGNKDRTVPLPEGMIEELRAYWLVHRNPLLIFPNVGRGSHDLKSMAARMHRATTPMPANSLQRLLVVARKQLNLPDATPHTLRHCFATHLLDAGINLRSLQGLMGHANISTTEIYLHLSQQNDRQALDLIGNLYSALPK
jgi:integrase/recombinase XerD